MPRPDPQRSGKLPRPRPGSRATPPSPRLARAVERIGFRLGRDLRLVLLSAAARRIGKRGSDSLEGEASPVVPDRPRNLSGGAAAALEFDD